MAESVSFEYVITDYPRVIEPTVSVLEMAIANKDGSRQMHLERLDPVAVHAAVIALPLTAVHFFGPTPVAAACQYMLAYNEAGLLVAMIIRDAPGWVIDNVFDCDFNGAPPTLPSLRMIFKDQRARDVFMYYLQQVRNGRIVNPSLFAALDGLADEIRVINVVPSPST
jgi:hypothetical protein